MRIRILEYSFLLFMTALPLLHCAGNPEDRAVVTPRQPPKEATHADSLRQLCGNKSTRIVYLEMDKGDWGGSLIGYDVESGTTKRILEYEGNRTIPILCSGGKRVIYTSNYRIYVVEWETSKVRYLCPGFCTDTWVDPASGIEWLFCRDTGTPDKEAPMVRRQLLNPAICDTVFHQWSIQSRWSTFYQVSTAGDFAVGFLPWNRCYVVENGSQPNIGHVTHVSYGCWSSVASGSSNVWFHLESPHRSLRFFRDTTLIGSFVPTFEHPPGNGMEINHPRFATGDSSLIGLSAGYEDNESYSPNSEIFLLRPDDQFTETDSWVRLTDDSLGNRCPDIWVGVDTEYPMGEFGESVPFSPETAVGAVELSLTKGVEPFQTFHPGDTIEIAWNSENAPEGVVVEITFNRGISFHPLTSRAITSSDESWPRFSWVVTETIQSGGTTVSTIARLVKLRVRSYFDSSIRTYTNEFHIEEQDNESIR